MGVIGDPDKSSSSGAVVWEACLWGCGVSRKYISVVCWCRQRFKEASLLMVSLMKGTRTEERVF